MAATVFTATIGVDPVPGRAPDPAAGVAAAVALVPDATAVIADIATLVADGATPTQGHVNTLNTDWGTFLTALTAYNAAVAALTADTADVTLAFNAATVVSMNKLNVAVRALLALVGGQKILT